MKVLLESYYSRFCVFIFVFHNCSNAAEVCFSLLARWSSVQQLTCTKCRILYCCNTSTFISIFIVQLVISYNPQSLYLSSGPTFEPYAWKIQSTALNMQTEHPVMYGDLADDSDCTLGQVFLHEWCHKRASEDAWDTGNIDKLRVAQYLKGRWKII